MLQKNGICVLVIFVVSLFTISKCFYIRDELMEPIDIAAAENSNKEDNLILQRVKRQVFRLDERKMYQPVGVQSRDKTVIVVPDRGTTAYRSIPNSPYGSNSLPNRGTTVVVSQVPEYNPNYNNMARSIDIIPVNPVMI